MRGRTSGSDWHRQRRPGRPVDGARYRRSRRRGRSRACSPGVRSVRIRRDARSLALDAQAVALRRQRREVGVRRVRVLAARLQGRAFAGRGAGAELHDEPGRRSSVTGSRWRRRSRISSRRTARCTCRTEDSNAVCAYEVQGARRRSCRRRRSPSRRISQRSAPLRCVLSGRGRRVADRRELGGITPPDVPKPRRPVDATSRRAPRPKARASQHSVRGVVFVDGTLFVADEDNDTREPLRRDQR